MASGPETFRFQIRDHIHTRCAPPKWWSSGRFHGEIWVSIPETGNAAGTRGGKGAQELKLIPLCSHLYALDGSSYFMAINNSTGCTAKIQITACSRWSRLRPYRFQCLWESRARRGLLGMLMGAGWNKYCQKTALRMKSSRHMWSSAVHTGPCKHSILRLAG